MVWWGCFIVVGGVVCFGIWAIVCYFGLGWGGFVDRVGFVVCMAFTAVWFLCCVWCAVVSFVGGWLDGVFVGIVVCVFLGWRLACSGVLIVLYLLD